MFFNMKKRRILTAMLIVLIIATTLFIWCNSLQYNVTDNLVQKLAHFVEYSALGCELALLLVLLKRRRWQSVVNCAFAAMVVALTDETIQIFVIAGV